MRKFFRNLSLGIRANASNISLIIIVLGFLGMFGLLAVNGERQNETLKNDQKILIQLQGLTSRLASNADTRTEQFNELNKHMDCIVEFFTDTTHSQKSISDINTCELTNNNTGATNSPPKSDSNTNTPTKPTNSPANNTNTRAAPTQPKKSIIDTLLEPINKLLKRS
jgi:Tfp pilus assembly protein PilV